MSELRSSLTSERAHGKSVFISYCVKDSDFILSLESALAKAGHIVWDERKLAPGGDWVAEIERAIEQCNVAVVVLSPNYVQSLSHNYEAGFLLNKADQENLKIIPVVTGEIQDSDIPYRLQRFQSLDGRGKSSHQLVGELVSIL
jgi:hypothetical protein